MNGYVLSVFQDRNNADPHEGQKRQAWDAWAAQLVKHLTSAQVTILGPWEQAPRRAPHSAWSRLVPGPLPLPHVCSLLALLSLKSLKSWGAWVASRWHLPLAQGVILEFPGSSLALGSSPGTCFSLCLSVSFMNK